MNKHATRAVFGVIHTYMYIYMHIDICARSVWRDMRHRAGPLMLACGSWLLLHATNPLCWYLYLEAIDFIYRVKTGQYVRRTISCAASAW